MSTLSKEYRRQLERVVLAAREEAERGAAAALESFGVADAKLPGHLDDAGKNLRRKLRAHGRQVGDVRRPDDSQEVEHLIHECAYEHWHRMLFARFLAENGFLIEPDSGLDVDLDFCEERARETNSDKWEIAAGFAQRMLTGVFRVDDPVLQVRLPTEFRNRLTALLASLPVEVFTASDSLGWVYQFWQAKKKEEVNESGVKIGADELPSVTQLFTEDYMVDFLLDNTLGAWHAGRVAALNISKFKAQDCPTEEAARKACALPGCEWKYLRFIQKDGHWTPAAGTFDGWPKIARELKCLDPCMGSGHFVVAIFERLVALRLAEEKLDEAAAVAAVIRDNLFGLEIDPRCTKIGAFNLALAAWRRVGHCSLPAMNLACSGLAPNTREADWLAIAGDNEKLRNGMERLYRLFQKAAVLGSLINPRAGEGDLLVAAFHELQPLLEKALAQETKDDTAHEMAVTARGLAKAAEILAGQFTLVATNVPYLGRGKQDEVLQDYCERVYPESKADLATCFVERCVDFAGSGNSTALVTPQSWLFMGTYKKLRGNLLASIQWDSVGRLGTRAFETISGEVVNVALLGFTRARPNTKHTFAGVDVTAANSPELKAAALTQEAITPVSQGGQLGNPDAKLMFSNAGTVTLLKDFAITAKGVCTYDSFRFFIGFWEVPLVNPLIYIPCHTTVENHSLYSGRNLILRWEQGTGQLAQLMRDKGTFTSGVWKAWARYIGQKGICISQIGNLPSSIYDGHAFDNNTGLITSNSPDNLAAIWCFCSSTDYCTAVRQIDQSLKIINDSMVLIPFDLAHWQKVAAEKYPHGLPKPFSSDPTQWLFNGHPAGADQPLHVAVARLLGYQWPRQTGSSFPDCPALGPDGLETLADNDGIVPISPAKGEGPAAERLRELLARAYDKDWNATRQEALLTQVDYAGASLEDWLRNGFFEQHCALFHQRPFIWHVWDGHKSGFSALVNYHKLDHANLEKLTYAYLGDWIRRQQAAVDAGEAGSDARLQAAKQLQARLKLILEGEPPYDIFVRWKPLAKQAIGWHPDLNDGVRMNIRTFATADILRKRVKIKWDKDRGKEPQRDKAEYPWFWGWDEAKADFAGTGATPDGNRWNDLHYTAAFKQKARAGQRTK